MNKVGQENIEKRNIVMELGVLDMKTYLYIYKIKTSVLVQEHTGQ